jgi:hypothetical protein
MNKDQKTRKRRRRNPQPVTSEYVTFAIKIIHPARNAYSPNPGIVVHLTGIRSLLFANSISSSVGVKSNANSSAVIFAASRG